MRNLNFLKLFYGLMLVMVSTAFVSCVDDNDDTEAPYLEVSPTTLIFGLDGQPANGSQASFDISTNRSWKATVKDDKSWVTLSKYEGEGSATIQVSIPENVNDEASVVIEISNKVGVLMSETVKITSGSVEPSVVIYNDNVGTIELDKTNWPFVDKYEGWNKTGIGSESVTYTGVNASVRNSGLANTDAYAGASGPNVVFFGKTPTSFNVNTITLTSGQKNLQLTFGASRSVNNNGTYDNTFDVSKFEVALSADGTAWVPITYTKNNGDADYPYWVFATANFTLKQVPENLYIRFTALDASAIRLDDITLATGAGGTEIDFGTAGEPKVTTTDAKAITATTATLGGSVANIEISEATEVGVQYIEFSTGAVTDIDWTKATKTAASVKENPWTVAVTNLTKDNQYAFRAYATTASSSIYGEPKTFVAIESTATPISIADLVTKMTSTPTAVDENYVIQGIICGDPAGKNYSYGTLYLMTKGATTAGNALSLYNNQIDVTQYALGQEIKVTLQKDVAKIYKRYDVPQVEGFSADNIEVISANNAVTPVKVTLSQLAAFVCMPVTVENVNIATGGVWKDADAGKNHTFNVAGTSFTVNINKNATPFDNQPYAATTASMTGIASIYQSAGQLAPRNLEDVSGFKVTEPTIVEVDPSSLSFLSTGGTKTITVTTANQGANVITATGLSGNLSSSVEGNVVTVTAIENNGGAVEQTLVIALGNSKVNVVVKQDAKGAVTKVYEKVTSAPSDWSGKYLITYTKEDGTTVNVLSGKGAGDYAGYVDILSAYNSSNETIAANDETNQYACTIAKVEGSEDQYTILLGSTYLGLTKDGNNLHFDSSIKDGFQWKFDDTKIIPVKYAARNLQWNNNNNQYRFACYKGTQVDVTIYKLTE
ncbi:DUF5689 domain-containing protein [Bacteroides thetaiotaomicron]|uniref:DUF5689 domain-containing protein n=1 Tax=Bacteroides thetaiotaomicron TaxID=818 RepID=UPI00189BE474|nr:DUF5689 domain-containing protein [Bacteroides thetaiotaomicron]